MNTPPVRVERRVGQRFPYLLPVSIRECSSGIEGRGFTQDLSSRGVFFFTDAAMCVGADIELTLRMPSEITLGQAMPVRCRGRVLRVMRPAEIHAARGLAAETKIGVAVRFASYEYLAESSESPLSMARISSLHPQQQGDKTLA